MRRIHHAAGLATGILFLVHAMSAQTGTISGVVQTPDGKPVPGAFVAIGLRPVNPNLAFTPFSEIIQTNAAGAFAASGLAAGTYQVCPQLASSSLISPCIYQNAPPMATVTGGQTTTMQALQLKPGVHIAVRINDPLAVLASVLGKVNGAAVFAGVTGTGIGVMPTTLVGQDVLGFTYDLLVPYYMALKFAISSKAFSITDQSNTAVDPVNGSTYPLQVASGAAPPSFTFSITGKTP
jgi:hypothetical protein